MEMQAFESVDQAADSAIAMLQNGEPLRFLAAFQLGAAETGTLASGHAGRTGPRRPSTPLRQAASADTSVLETTR